MPKLAIRKATVDDAGLILDFITDLARYEKAESEVIATADDLKRNLFNPDTTTDAVICLSSEVPIGFAVYFLNFSTWLGKDGLYLEDLYISPEHRGLGAGKCLLRYLAKLSLKMNCGRFEWNVLDWNEPAIRVYESIGAKAQKEWVGYRLDGQSLVDSANGGDD